MRFLPHSIVSEFKYKILDDAYYPKNPIETLKARLTATLALQDANPDIARQAAAFIHKTSTSKQEDLSRLQKLPARIKTWDELQICSAYTNTVGTFLEYQLSYTTVEGSKQSMHFHARYEIKEGRCCFVSQTSSLIRLIGDPVLQKPGGLFPEDPTHEQLKKLAAQIDIAKSVLIQTSGAGIAANQVAAIEEPYRFTIVGVFSEIPEHVIGVERRYPGTKFPEARIMVNPLITAVSKDTQYFNHACLSVPCPNRCAVVSPKEMSVRYQDPNDDLRVKEETFRGIDAVVLWHELTHIIYGKTYMDITFESISVDDLLQFRKMLIAENMCRRTGAALQIPDLTVPPFHFSVKMNAEGIPTLDPLELAAVLRKMSEETLNGLLNQAQDLLKKKGIIRSDVSGLSLFQPSIECKVTCCDPEGSESKILSKL